MAAMKKSVLLEAHALSTAFGERDHVLGKPVPALLVTHPAFGYESIWIREDLFIPMDEPVRLANRCLCVVSFVLC